MIRLIQSAPKELKLDGGDKLRFFADLADPGKRIGQIGEDLHRLLG